MLARALIVVLLALNLGVAAWWLLRPAPEPYRVPSPDPGVATLEVIRPASATSAPDTAATAPPAADPTPAAPARCMRIGPFADLAAAEATQAALATLLAGAVLDEIPMQAPGYRVLLPPAADTAAAQALARQVGEAGFQDYLVIAQGAEANAIALGSYRSRDSALRRLQALRQAGFPAVMRAQGRAASSQWWLEAQATQADVVRARLEGVEATGCQLDGEAAQGPLR